MTVAAVNKTYDDVGTLLGKFSWKFPYQKSITVIQQIIKITTDTKTVKMSNELFEKLIEIQNSLPVTVEDIKKDKISKHLDVINENLSTINAFFETMDIFFKDHQDEDIIIDEPNMVKLMDNMKKSKSIIEYISEYLMSVLAVEKSKKAIKEGKAKKYCFTKEEKFVEIAA